MGAHQNFIAGQWVDGSSVTRDVNPSNTNDVVGEYAQADAAQTNAAIEAAHVAFPAWSRTTPQERHDLTPGRAERDVVEHVREPIVGVEPVNRQQGRRVGGAHSSPR